jgi:hypothetical protein
MTGLEAAMFVREMMMLVAAGLTMINPKDKPASAWSVKACNQADG